MGGSRNIDHVTVSKSSNGNRQLGLPINIRFRPLICVLSSACNLLHSLQYHANPTMARRRKNRTHLKGGNAAAAAEEGSQGPKSFVIKVSFQYRRHGPEL